MDGHSFEPLFVDEEAGNVIVRWDGLDARTITCRIPTDEAGAVLAPDEFKADIMAQCVRSLEHWDKLAQADVAEARKYVGQAFDVTEEYVLRNIKE
jgi:hypothetical protein